MPQIRGSETCWTRKLSSTETSQKATGKPRSDELCSDSDTVAIYPHSDLAVKNNVLQWAYNKLEQHLNGCKIPRMQLLKSHPYAPLLATEMSGSSNLHAYHTLPQKKNIKKWRGFEKEVSHAMERWGSQWEIEPRFMHEPHSRNQACRFMLFMGLLDPINYMMTEDTLKENWSDHKIFFWSLRLSSAYEYAFSKISLALPNSKGCYWEQERILPTLLVDNDLDIGILTSLGFWEWRRISRLGWDPIS
ncbi:hypothetical protein SELMODRAFT_407636 [Selaginella moellendorffii]|uniref:Uncharacterized protein n=1 Tax=Selaginella moellendorffii TaxID=88036 RepID=D8R689_SELML|nr:hypothetical protein SELMODRAFT_407636 [Selaginella moellendorffii]